MNTFEPIFTSDEKFLGKCDADTIQNAVNFAKESGQGMVTIPCYNPRTNSNLWEIEHAILLPSEMTVIVSGAHLRLADGVFDNIFRNENCRTPLGNTMEGEQHDIHIIGVGNAVLDGGKHNGLVEQMHRDNPEKYPCLSINLLIFLHNVRNFSIEKLNIKESRWWSICCIYCRWGKLSDLDFRMYGTSENQDGIDLRVGCEYITIENITGITGDDTVALTALPLDDLVPETELKVEGKLPDIHDVTIRNVKSASHGCNVIRFLCEDGAKEYNIFAENIMDTGEAISGAVITFGVGNTMFAKDHPHVMGDMRNIVVKNVTSAAQRGIILAEPMQDIVIENYTTYNRNNVAVRMVKNFACKNLTIRNMTCRSDKGELDSLFWGADRKICENIENFVIENVDYTETNYIFRKCKFDIRNLNGPQPKISEYSDENAVLPSAYGRYHKNFLGKEIQNRPKDNRFTGENKIK